MTNIIAITRLLLIHDSGQGTIEYALVAAVIGLGGVAVVRPLAEEVRKLIAAVTAMLGSVA